VAGWVRKGFAAKKRPNRLHLGSAGTGGTPRVSWEVAPGEQRGGSSVAALWQGEHHVLAWASYPVVGVAPWHGHHIPSWASHPIIEWFGLEGTLEIIQFPPPCHGQGPLPPAQGPPSPIQPGPGSCQGGDSHSFSGQPGPGPHHPHGEEFLPNI